MALHKWDILIVFLFVSAVALLDLIGHVLWHTLLAFEHDKNVLLLRRLKKLAQNGATD